MGRFSESYRTLFALPVPIRDLVLKFIFDKEISPFSRWVRCGFTANQRYRRAKGVKYKRGGAENTRSPVDRRQRRSGRISVFLFGLLLFSFSPRHIAVVAIVPEQLLAFVRGCARRRVAIQSRDGEDRKNFSSGTGFILTPAKGAGNSVETGRSYEDRGVSFPKNVLDRSAIIRDFPM